MVNFSKRLEAAMALPRQSRGPTTLKMLADACGITYQAVKKWTLSPTAKLNAEHCAAAANYLGVRTHWLATGHGAMMASKTQNSEYVRLLSNGAAWPFTALTEAQWLSIDADIRSVIEKQIVALVPSAVPGKKSA